MKTKFTLKNDQGEMVFYLKKEDKTYVATYNNKEYMAYPVGEVVTYNGHTRAIREGDNIINIEGNQILVVERGKFASEDVTAEKGKVTYSFVGNNMKKSLPLLIGLGVVLVVIVIALVVSGGQ